MLVRKATNPIIIKVSSNLGSLGRKLKLFNCDSLIRFRVASQAQHFAPDADKCKNTKLLWTRVTSEVQPYCQPRRLPDDAISNAFLCHHINRCNTNGMEVIHDRKIGRLYNKMRIPRAQFFYHENPPEVRSLWIAVANYYCCFRIMCSI